MIPRPATLGAVAVAVLGLAATPSCVPPHPSDGEYALRFEQRRGEFERLIGMIAEEPRLRRMAHDWAEDRDGNRYFGPTQGLLSAERWGGFRQLFYDLELSDGFRVDDDGVWLLGSARGHGVGRTVKGYAFLSTVTGKLPRCGSPDGAAAFPDGGTCLTPLEANWFLFSRQGSTAKSALRP